MPLRFRRPPKRPAGSAPAALCRRSLPLRVMDVVAERLWAAACWRTDLFSQPPRRPLTPDLAFCKWGPKTHPSWGGGCRLNGTGNDKTWCTNLEPRGGNKLGGGSVVILTGFIFLCSFLHDFSLLFKRLFYFISILSPWHRPGRPAVDMLDSSAVIVRCCCCSHD